MIRPAVAGLAVLGLLAAAPADAAPGRPHPSNASHVLLLSIDGLHQQDLDWYVRNHPHSTLARLAASGTSYRNAATPFPSDSFPGMLAQVTGGDPRTTGVYYDDTWNAALLPAGTTDCAGAEPGAEV